jgi:hypothetical protein
MTLLYSVECVAPLLNGCGAADVSCKCMLGGEVLIEEAEQLFKGSKGTQ